MVRTLGFAACLVVLALGLLVGCGTDHGPMPAASSKPAAVDEARYAEAPLAPASTSPADPFAAPVAPAASPADAAPLALEMSVAETTSAPQQGAYAGRALSGREPGTKAALLRAYGGNAALPLPADQPGEGLGPGQGGDKFAHQEENTFLAVKDAPLSTFSIDVDTASYSKTRQYLMQHHMLPPADAVRIEELVNYFDYSYAGPKDEHPFAVHLETAECPWQPKHRLVRCALQGKKLDGNRPVSNLVFLIDVSGSMNQPNKLPLVQRSLQMLVRQLGENDRVSIVVYAGAAGQVLPPTSGVEQATILNAIENLRAGGSTNGGQGIQLSYQLAQQNFIKGGTNRVILCSDGDFNVGVTSTGDLIRMAKEKADLGIYLSVLGFGIGNHNDAMMEELSNKANGNYAFIDSDAEAKKVFVEQMEGTLVTIAKDVKIQVEFNPAQVAAYRLIGYENRKLANRDFNDDKKDAGDIGAGHRVTALYEIVPVGVESEFTKPLVDALKYQGNEKSEAGKPEAPAKELTEAAKSGELLTLKLRYQPPTGGQSTLMTFPVKDSDQRFSGASPDFQFAAAVASFGMLLRNSQHKGNTSYAAVIETANASKGKDEHGLRNEFLQMVAVARSLAGQQEPAAPVAPGLPAPAAGAWLPPQPPVMAVVRQPTLKCGTVDPPRYTWGRASLVFVGGVTLGVGLAAVVVVFALGVVSLRTFLLANQLPPAKVKVMK